MKDQNIFLAKTTNPTPLKSLLSTNAATEKVQPLTITFEGDQKVLLDQNNPQAISWAKKIDYLQKNNRPVYIETDDNNTITKLCTPEAALIWKIETEDERIVHVYLHTNCVVYTLNRDHSNFETMLNDLHAAMDKGSQVLVTATHREYEITDVRPMLFLFGNEEPEEEEEPEPDVPAKTVTPERAEELFKMMQTKTCTAGAAKGTDCVPFNYPGSGCWVRAHLMGFFLREQKETPAKIWCDGRPYLWAFTKNDPNCRVGWGWHVAVTLVVEDKNGKKTLTVFDPSLSDKPLPAKDWQDLQNDVNSVTRESKWQQYHHFSGTASKKTANIDMEEHRVNLDNLCREQGAPPPYDCSGKF
ncbi:MAG: hypothetical protein IAF38_03985 [Bacteroidia bacterium]|nr:hypothetical protein [Bacteroidia bacterium]